MKKALQNNKRFLKQAQPSDEAKAALKSMWQKNPALKLLIKTFDLDIRTMSVANDEEQIDKSELVKALLQEKKDGVNNNNK